MGYRSEVAIALTEDAAVLLEVIAEHDSELGNLLKDSDGNRDPEYYKVHWDYIKWYEGYDEIDTVQQFLASLDDEYYMFIRLGEEADDIQQEGSYYESDMYVQRSISW